MNQKRSTKRALFASVTSVLLCCAMLIGTTFAWFTDTVTSGKNTIVAGNLDVELEYATAYDDAGNPTEWEAVTEETTLFQSADETLWEPGHTEYVNLRVHNAGTLALKYQFAAAVAEEKEYTNIEGSTFKLSDYLVFSKTEGAAKPANREALWLEAEAEKEAMGLEALESVNAVDVTLTAGESEEFTLAVYMPISVGNEANQSTADREANGAPTIELGLNVVATQAEEEADSFGSSYDAGAEYPKTEDVEYVEIPAGTDSFAAARMFRDNGAVALVEDIEMSPYTFTATMPNMYVKSADGELKVLKKALTNGGFCFYQNDSINPFDENGVANLTLENIKVEAIKGEETSGAIAIKVASDASQPGEAKLDGKTININGGIIATDGNEYKKMPMNPRAAGAIVVYNTTNSTMNFNNMNFELHNGATLLAECNSGAMGSPSKNPCENNTYNFTNCTITSYDAEGNATVVDMSQYETLEDLAADYPDMIRLEENSNSTVNFK